MHSIPSTSPTEISPDELERQGIARIATERFEVSGYRYDRLSDAVAEARRRDALGEAR